MVLSITTPLSRNKMFDALPGLSKTWRHRAPVRRDPRPAKLRAGQPSAKFPEIAGILAQPALLDPCAASLDQYNQNDENQHTGNNPDDHGSIHIDSSFPQRLLRALNDCMMEMIAGPRATRKIDGKINSTSGNVSLMVVFAAASSTACTRWVLSVSL